MKNIKKRHIWIIGELVVIIFVLLFHYLHIEPCRDYFIIVGIVSIGEVVWRQFHGQEKSNKEKLYFIIMLREEHIKELLRKAKRGEDVKMEIEDLRRLTESSLSMLGTLSAIVLALVILALSLPKSAGTPLEVNIKIKIFVISGFFTFILLVIDLALCYSLLEPAMKDFPEIIIGGMRKYYHLTMFGLIMLGITFIWGIYTYTEMFHITTFWGRISLVLLAILLLFLYRVSYIYKISKVESNDGGS